jgi:hypothetical protein
MRERQKDREPLFKAVVPFAFFGFLGDSEKIDAPLLTGFVLRWPDFWGVAAKEK